MRSRLLLSLTLVTVMLPVAAATNSSSQFASNGEMYGWVKDLWAMGANSEIGFRQPGTAADHEAAHYLLDKLEGWGYGDARLEPVTFPLWTPLGTGLTATPGGAPVGVFVGVHLVAIALDQMRRVADADDDQQGHNHVVEDVHGLAEEPHPPDGHQGGDGDCPEWK